MTKYDPFSFGMLPKREPEEPAAVDDALFAAPTPAPSAVAPGSRDDWEPPADPPASMFEDPPAPAVSAPATAAASQRSAPAIAAVPASPASVGKVAAPAPRASVSRLADAPARPARVPTPLPKGSRAMSLLVPLVILGGGGGAATWFFVWQQNPVMGAILAAGSVVAGALAFVGLRR